MKRTFARSATLIAGLFSASIARGGEPVIPPGQEALILDMLGGGAPIAGCKLLGAEVQKTTIAARFACEGAPREIAIELRHAGGGAAATATTARFAIAARERPELAAAIAERVRSREARFLWDALEPDAPDPARPRPDMDRPRRAAVWIALLALPLSLAWLRDRRRRARR